ncbi:MAG TPA: hypothetical protein DCM05_02665 [Elusimicrobia bacterium]|nr:hypothetical protein [Elusimicrobiota bacterium]
MGTSPSEPVFIPGDSPLQAFSLLLLLLVHDRILLTPHAFERMKRTLARLGLEGRIGILDCKAGDHPGLWYETNLETLRLAEEAWRAATAGTAHLASAYDRFFRSDKMDVFLKGQLALELFAVLLDLHLLRLTPDVPTRAALFLPDTPLNRFAMDHLRKTRGFSPNASWVMSMGWLALPLYYLWLVREVFRRGFRLGSERKAYAVARELSDGFGRAVLRDDPMVDGRGIQPRDVLFLDRSRESPHPAAGECPELGYDLQDLDTLPIPLGPGAAAPLLFYFVRPVLDALRLAAQGNLQLLPAAAFFLKQSWPYDVLLRSFRVRLISSNKDWGDVPQTMAANRHGARSFLIQWSDITAYPEIHHAFIAHDLYFFWGEGHRDFHAGHKKIAQPLSTGCIFKASFLEQRRRADALRERIGLGRGRAVSFFDTTFGDVYEYPEAMFLRYLDSMRLCARALPETLFLLKRKRFWLDSYDSLISPTHRAAYRERWDALRTLPNFKDVSGSVRDPEALIAVSDVVVTLAMTSPSTIALLCGVDALYYDDSGNRQHPFCRLPEKRLVLDAPQALADRVAEILQGRARPTQLLSESDLRPLDAHRDAGALERIRDVLRAELSSSK